MITFLSVFSPYRGGIATFSDHLLDALQNSGEQITPVNFRKQYPNLLFPGKNQLLDNPSSVIDPRLYHSYQPLNWISTARHIALQQPDWLLLSQWHPFFIPGYRILMSQVKRHSPEIRFAAVVHNVIPHEAFPFQKPLLRSLFGSLDLSVVLSDQTEQEIHEVDSNTNVQRLYHPIYERELSSDSKDVLRKRWSVQKDSIVLLFFGLIRDYKGIDVLFEALNQIVSEKDSEPVSLEIIVAGEFYTDRAELENVLTPKAKQHVHIFDKFMNDEELGELFVLSDAMILPYKTASQSGVVAEAMAAGLPVITTNHPGLTNYVMDGENGLIAEPDDADDLARVLQRLSREELDSMHVQQLAKSKAFSWEAFAERFVEQLNG